MNKFEKLTSIEIENYKSIKKLTLELASVNILVGGNNAGKTCIIQAIHFATALTQTAHEENAANFSPEKLRYTPTETFLNLKYNEPLSEQGTPIKITFHADIIETKHNFALNEDGTTNYTKQIASHSKKEFSHSVSLKRGRNSTISTDNPKIANLLGKTIADTINPFSIYVPGLAGIPTKEEYRGRLVIDRGAMRGDANLFLRNILYRLHQDSSKLREFNKYLNKLFPSMKIDAIDFSERKSELIIVSYTENGQTRPLEMIGTGTLQAIQILSYITFYEPKILLLDEPDAHLHPNKQKELIELLLEISKIKKIQIIIATHSRHIVHSTYENTDTKLFLISGGEKKTDNPSIADLLLDIGAIDKFDSIDLLGKKYLVLSEDEKSENDPNHPLRLILESTGINKNEMKVMAYNGCTQQRSVILLSSFMSKHHPEIKVIIHRDRDFMTDTEVNEIVRKDYAKLDNIILFVTQGSDVESHLLNPNYLASISNIPKDKIESIIQKISIENHNEFIRRFTTKRAEIKSAMRSKEKFFEKTEKILSKEIPLPIEQIVGKDMWKILKEYKENDTLVIPSNTEPKPSEWLKDQNLASLLSH